MNGRLNTRTPGSVYASMTPAQKELHGHTITYTRRKFARSGFALGFVIGTFAGLAAFLLARL